MNKIIILFGVIILLCILGYVFLPIHQACFIEGMEINVELGFVNVGNFTCESYSNYNLWKARKERERSFQED